MQSLAAGDKFYFQKKYDVHLWMIISDPGIDPVRVIIVNFTTWHDWRGDSCIVMPSEHPFVTHKTCVNYSDAKLVSLKQLDSLEAAGQVVKQIEPLSSALLRRIREGARDELKSSFVQILIDQGLIE